MPPLAPERFSTTMVWPMRSCMRLPTMRATVSGSPPAGWVMMNLMVAPDAAGWLCAGHGANVQSAERGKCSKRGART